MLPPAIPPALPSGSFSGLPDDTFHTGGKLPENITRFVHLLRQVGLTPGTAQLIIATRALTHIGCADKTALFWALHTTLIRRREDFPLFQLCFRLFWHIMPATITASTQKHPPTVPAPAAIEGALPADKPRLAGARRLADALLQKQPQTTTHILKAALLPGETPGLRDVDFADMTMTEFQVAKAAIVRLNREMFRLPIRRYRAHSAGTVADWRRSLRTQARMGGDTGPLWYPPSWQQKIRRPPPIVVLCDISGSMAAYTRAFLHFLHALSGSHMHVHSFVFGTTLHNITRLLAHSDADTALARVTHAVEDWAGGTKLGKNLAHFNQFWGRRVLGQNAVVMLITDGLELGDTAELQKEALRLHRSTRYLLWLNPLMGYHAYAPKARGAHILHSTADDSRALHNVHSLETLAEILTTTRLRRRNKPQDSHMVRTYN